MLPVLPPPAEGGTVPLLSYGWTCGILDFGFWICGLRLERSTDFGAKLLSPLFLKEYIYGQSEQDHSENLLEIGGGDMLHKACSNLGTDDAADTE